jgi:hypothetical protein
MPALTFVDKFAPSGFFYLLISNQLGIDLVFVCLLFAVGLLSELLRFSLVAIVKPPCWSEQKLYKG